MMMIVELHDEVIKFLNESGNVFRYEDGAHGFDLNGTTYTSTDTPGTYTVQYIDIELDGNN